MSKSSVSRKIAKATELSHQIKLMQAQLDLLKVDIRAEAFANGLGPVATPIELDCRHGVCSVAFVEESLSIIKESDPRDLASILRPAIFQELFTERLEIVLRPTSLKVYKETLTSTERKVSSKILELKPGTPRVTLPKMP